MPRLTREQLFTLTQGKPGYVVVAGLHNPLSEHHARQESLAAHQDEAPSKARLEVRITRYATKTLDADNAAGGCKYLCDALRYAGMIPDDDPDSIELIVKQKRVKKRKECGTLIEIINIQ